jgi:hypothetical protein
MNGMALPNGAVVVPGVDSAWFIKGIGDLDGDGDADLIWRNTTTGDVAVWLMDGQTLVAGVVVARVPTSHQWIIVAAGDLDGPG